MSAAASIRTVTAILCFAAPAGCFAQANLNLAQLIQRGRANERATDAYAGVFLPTDRNDSRGIQQARQRIAAGEYAQAIRFLDEVLNREEDSFVRSDQRSDYVGLKASARQIIGDLLPAGREAYETTFGPVARRELRKVVATGDYAGLKRLVRRYFHTPAGLEAALLLADHEADMGRQLAAALAYDQLLATPAAARFQPQLGLKSVVSWLAVGNDQRAESIVNDLLPMQPRFGVAGREYQLRASQVDPLDWLRQTLGEPSAKDFAPEQQWLTPRGNPARNGQAKGGLPHMRVAWEVRLLSHPALEDAYDEIWSSMTRSGRVALPAAAPLAVGDYLITRCARNLIAIDFATGKRVWQTQPQRMPALEKLANGDTDAESDREDQQPARTFAQRIWEDRLYNTISSDGQRVYVIRDLSPPQIQDFRQFGMPAQRESSAAGTNRLCAYDLVTQGKLVWEIDGRARSDRLEGAFFLGAPLAIGKSLYAIVEIHDERAIYLTAIDRQTGALQWRQRLADLETDIVADSQRRLQSSMPSYDAGILVCPTGAGVVVGIDLAKSSLAWAYRYESKQTPRLDFRGRRNLAPKHLGKWADSSITIAKGKVLLTPPESNSLHCLDLATGRLLWQRDRGTSLYVAGVDDGRVLLVGQRSLSAVRLEDGEASWSQPKLLLEADAMPTGRGIMSDGKYYLPLSTAEVIAVDMELGEIVGRALSRSGQLLGNLVCYRGAVISQTGRFLDRLEQVEVLRSKSEARLVADPDDFQALRTLGGVAFNEGQLDRAIEMLERAYKSEPSDLQTREVLRECLLTALDEDFVRHRTRMPLFAEIQDSTEQGRLTLLRLQTQGLLEVGDTWSAFVSCLQMVDLVDRSQKMLQIGRDHQVELSRWLQIQIATIWEKADLKVRRKISERLEKMLDLSVASDSKDRTRQLLACFGSLAIADSLRLQLAEDYATAGDLLRAQQLLLALTKSTDESLRGQAVARCSALLHQLGFVRLAHLFDSELRGSLADTLCLDGKTGRQCVDSLSPTGGLDWPYGLVKASPVMSRDPRTRLGARSPLSELRLERCDEVLGSCNVFLESNRRLIVRDSQGTEIFRTALEEDNQFRMVRYGSAYGVSRGSLLVLSLGSRVVAINTLAAGDKNSDAMLWRRATSSRLGRQFPAIANASGGAAKRPGSYRAPRSQQDGKWIGILGPLTRDSCIFQEQQRLLCVHPLTGELKWSRSDVPSNCDLFGDDRYLFVVPRGQTIGQIFSTIDGRRLGETTLPLWQEQVATLGRHFLRWRKRIDRKMELSSIDALTGETVWTKHFDAHSALDVAQGRYVAIVERSGRCVVVDGVDGEYLIDHAIRPTSNIHALHLLAGTDNFVVAVQELPRASTRGRAISVLNSGDFTPFDGQVVVFDRASGKPAFDPPATVERQALMLSQGADLPVVAFAGNIRRRDSNGGRQSLGVLLLEKASGRVLFDNDSLPTSVNHFVLHAAEADQSTLVVEMASREIQLDFSGENRPPEPPAMHQVTAETGKNPKGLLNLGKKLFGF